MPRTISHAWAKGRRVVHSGGELQVKHLGRVRFRQHVMLEDGREWLDVVHPVYGFYSVKPERVESIPYKMKLRPARVKTAVAA